MIALNGLRNKATSLVLLFAFSLLGRDLRSVELGFSGGWVNFIPDKNKPREGMGVNFFLQKQLSHNLSVLYGMGFSANTFEQGRSKNFTTVYSNFFTQDFMMNYEISPDKPLSPYLLLGIGGINFQVNHRIRFWDSQVFAGVGAALRIGPNSRLLIDGSYHITSGDEFDDYVDGKDDRYYSVKAGFSFELSKPNNKPASAFFSMANQAQAESGTSGSYQFQQNNTADISPAAHQDVQQTINTENEPLFLQKVRDLKIELSLYDIQISQIRNEISIKDHIIKQLEIQLNEKISNCR